MLESFSKFFHSDVFPGNLGSSSQQAAENIPGAVVVKISEVYNSDLTKVIPTNGFHIRF